MDDDGGRLRLGRGWGSNPKQPYDDDDDDDNDDDDDDDDDD